MWGVHIRSRLMTSTTLGLVMLPTMLGATGCFDAHGVDPGPWVIDDFEDGDLTPADRNFGPWNCYTWPQQKQYPPVLDSGDQSTSSLAFDFAIVSPAAGTTSDAGAGVQTVAVRPGDFSRFSEMIFRSKIVPGVSPLPSTANFTAHLGCSAVALEGSQTIPATRTRSASVGHRPRSRSTSGSTISTS